MLASDQIWRAILKNEELHIGRMVTDEFMKAVREDRIYRRRDAP